MAIVVAVVLAVTALGFTALYAGSPGQLAEGVRIAGVDVGGLSPADAARVLERSESALSRVPLQVRVGTSTYRVLPADLSLAVDWQTAVAEAQDRVDGFGPIRGFRRLAARAFGVEISPPATVDRRALRKLLDRMAGHDLRHRNAAIRLVGLRPVLVPPRPGLVLDREAAERAILGALAGLDRAPVMLSSRVDEPTVTAPMLEPELAKVQLAVSKPVRLRLGSERFVVSRRQLARLLELPSGGSTKVRIGGRPADVYFAGLGRRVARPPRDAGFVPVADGRVLVKPSVDGRALDVPRTATKLLTAALSPTRRVAPVVVGVASPSRTTAEAKAMGIDFVLSSFKTYNAGDWNRITNLRLGVQALDGTLVPPGGTFSLNRAIGERTEERGFRMAPVILGNRYAEEIGGGTSQVATTVFNAVWEAGLKVAERNPHALYISRYPLGRDATVYWPTLDLRFVNDTASWVLVKGFAETDGIRVSIYGGERRRVDSSPGTFEYSGSPPVKRIKDPSLPKGTTAIEEAGTRPSKTSVTRTIYGEDGQLMRTETWNTNYRGETRIIRVGTKPKPKKREQPAQELPTADTKGPGV